MLKPYQSLCLRPIAIQLSSNIDVVEEIRPDFLYRPSLVSVTWRVVRVMKRKFTIADHVEESFAVFLVGVLFRVVVPDLCHNQSSDLYCQSQSGTLTHLGNLVRIKEGFSAMALQSVK